jgi:hypothetical protein
MTIHETESLSFAADIATAFYRLCSCWLTHKSQSSRLTNSSWTLPACQWSIKPINAGVATFIGSNTVTVQTYFFHVELGTQQGCRESWYLAFERHSRHARHISHQFRTNAENSKGRPRGSKITRDITLMEFDMSLPPPVRIHLSAFASLSRSVACVLSDTNALWRLSVGTGRPPVLSKQYLN